MNPIKLADILAVVVLGMLFYKTVEVEGKEPTDEKPGSENFDWPDDCSKMIH